MSKLRHGLVAGVLSGSLLFGPAVWATEVKYVFEDIENHWAYDQISVIHNQGILFPVENQRFYPNQEVTRAELVSMIMKALQTEDNGEYAELVGQAFADVGLDKWYAQDLGKAKRLGIILGDADGFFRPDDSINRAEIAVIIQRAYPYLNSTGQAYFADVSNQHWAAAEIEQVSQAGLIQGYRDNTYKPDQPVTRAEATVIISRLLTTEKSPEPTKLAFETIEKESLTTYNVQPGDSLWKISQAYGTSVDELMGINQLPNDHLQIGQALVLPESAARATNNEKIESVEDQSADLRVVQNDNLSNEELTYTASAEVELLPWTEADHVFAIGKTAKVTDVYTGKTFQVKRNYGANHADSEPLTAVDTQVMNDIWGGSTWDTRPVIVEVDGRRLAAAMHNMPHSVQQITDNNYNGHTCIHFLGSTKHNDGQAWESMQRDVQIAASYKQ